ncbi:hypothetical protein [Hymenobacter sp. AT01-02]|uniref:hypothetical protein n=1 Tax=Hymenobacter sp. AT01-02 TaxID=1571877 RepID=UPI00069728C3|nr:hypothetical protein [Hymenobacter sp. AT01-02]
MVSSSSAATPAPAPTSSSTTHTGTYRQCTRCIMDTTVPGIRFDGRGECNFCQLHDKLDRAFPLGEVGHRHVAPWLRI